MTRKIDFSTMAETVKYCGDDMVGLKEMRCAAELSGKPLLSFPSGAPKMKIDYIFVSSDTEMKNADIPEAVASNHRPQHTASIEF